MSKVTRLHGAVDTTARFVRVTNRDHRGFVEFQFFMGAPDLYLEMTLPPAAFTQFCRDQHARELTAAEAARVDAGDRRWQYGDDDEE